jgi:ATP-dependent DNA helicase 2 subunit 2
VSGINLTIGSEEEFPDEFISIPIKYSKATMKARPPSLSKGWKAAMDLQAPKATTYRDQNASQLLSSLAQQSQSQAQGTGAGDKVDPSELAAMISAEVKQHSTYVIKRQPPGPPGGTQATQATQASQQQGYEDFVGMEDPSQMQVPAEEDLEEEFVEKEDIVKAWRFGSTWVPMEADLFEPLNTTKGVEILNFIPIANVSRSAGYPLTRVD